MKKHLKLTPILLLAAFVAGCQGPCEKLDSITGPALTSGTADFTTYVAAGTSISAGYQSGGIVDRHQMFSFPAIFARQIGKTVLQNGQGDFTFPSMGFDGFPQLLAIKSFSPLIVNNTGRTLGYPAANYTQATAFHNMGVPGAIAFDFADTTRYHATADPNMFSVVARYRGTVAQQVLGKGPTFLSYEYGANEVLGNATSGGLTPIFPASTYALLLTGHMNAIHGALPNTKIAVFTVPDVASIPFCTTFKPYTVMLSTGATTPLLVKPASGTTPENLSPNDLVLLTAKDSLAVGTGFPVGAYNYLNPAAPGNGRGLARSQVLDVSEHRGGEVGVAWSARPLALTELVEPREVRFEARAEHRIAQHLDHGGRERDGDPRSHTVALDAPERGHEREVRAGERFEEPALFEVVAVFGVPHEGQVRVEDQREMSERHRARRVVACTRREQLRAARAV